MRSIKPGRNRARLFATLVAFTAMLGFTALTGSPAQAAYGNCVSVNGSSVCFNPDGELLRVCDTDADGRHASAAYRGSADRAYYEAGAYGGNGTCTTFNFDMPESSSIAYHALVVEGDDIKTYSWESSGWVSAADGKAVWPTPTLYLDEVVMD